MRESYENLDTVKYIGQGKNSQIVPGKPGDFDDECVRWVDANYFSIQFLPNKPKHKPLFFDLQAVGSSSYFTYDFMNTNLNTPIRGIETGNTTGYMPVFNFRGQEYYHVSEAKITSGDGSITRFLMAGSSNYFRGVTFKEHLSSFKLLPVM